MKNDSQSNDLRVEHDTLGQIAVPRDALYGAQTQRAVENFPISGLRFPREAIEAIALIKQAAAVANLKLQKLDNERSAFIQKAAIEIASGRYDDQFPVDVFMTGSGTSFNMNANEVIAALAEALAYTDGTDLKIHPNDHVNMGQSSNDVMPSVLHLTAITLLSRKLIPALSEIQEGIEAKAKEFEGVTKTGRTHLMDAMPIYLSDELQGWAHQFKKILYDLEQSYKRLTEIAIGGTAVGNGINSEPQFASLLCNELTHLSGYKMMEAENHFAAQSSMDEMVNLSGLLKTLATSLMKIANDIRWMNSGPNAGLGEIQISPVQPGSSIMPGKNNPVICEAAMQVCAQVIGNDVSVSVANERGNFQLNVMLPVLGYNVWQSISLLANVIDKLNATTIQTFKPRLNNLNEQVSRNPIVVTALAPKIGYEKASEIAKRAFDEGKPVLDIAHEVTGIDIQELQRILNPSHLAEGNKKRDI